MKELETLWETVLTKLETTTSSISFELWIKTLKILEYIDNKTLVLVAPSVKAKNHIQLHYIENILSAVKAIFGQETEIKIIDNQEKEEYLKEQSITSQNISSNTQTENPFNEKYTFENFVVGKSNQFVYAGALAVAKYPGTKFNPLFIYGGVGLGKTHLLHAIGNYIRQNHPQMKIKCTTCENFTNDYIESLLSKREESKIEFREKYRNVDVLMIDDIQFLSNKESTQEEFFHTFNDLYQNQKQIIITSDRPPKEIATLAERLESRFKSGLIQDIQAPDYETRIAILRKKAQQERYFIDDDVLEFIAAKINTNIRVMEGFLSKVHFLASLLGKRSATLEEAQEAFKDDIDHQKRSLTMDSITTAVCSYFNVEKSDIVGKKKSKEIVEPRMISIYLIKELIDPPLMAIGNFFGGRDHTTIMHARDKISEQLKTDPEIKNVINQIKSSLSIS